MFCWEKLAQKEIWKHVNHESFQIHAFGSVQGSLNIDALPIIPMKPTETWKKK